MLVKECQYHKQMSPALLCGCGWHQWAIVPNFVLWDNPNHSYEFFYEKRDS